MTTLNDSVLGEQVKSQRMSWPKSPMSKTCFTLCVSNCQLFINKFINYKKFIVSYPIGMIQPSPDVTSFILSLKTSLRMLGWLHSN